MARVSLPIIRRRLFTVVSAVSLLLCIATVVLWVRSYWRCDRWNRVTSSGEARLFLLSTCGHFGAAWRPHWGDGPLNRWERFSDSAFALDEPTLSISRWGTDGEGWNVAISHWLAAVLFSIAPTWWLLFSRHRRCARRLRLGLCPDCGYDLRASPDRCPECGAISHLV